MSPILCVTAYFSELAQTELVAGPVLTLGVLLLRALCRRPQPMGFTALEPINRATATIPLPTSALTTLHFKSVHALSLLRGTWAVGDNSGILAAWNMFMEENLFPSDKLSFSVSNLAYTQALQVTIRSGRHHASVTQLYFQHAFMCWFWLG